MYCKVVVALEKGSVPNAQTRWWRRRRKGWTSWSSSSRLSSTCSSSWWVQIWCPKGFRHDQWRQSPSKVGVEVMRSFAFLDLKRWIDTFRLDSDPIKRLNIQILHSEMMKRLIWYKSKLWSYVHVHSLIYFHVYVQVYLHVHVCTRTRTLHVHKQFTLEVLHGPDIRSGWIQAWGPAGFRHEVFVDSDLRRLVCSDMRSLGVFGLEVLVGPDMKSQRSW